MASPSSPKPFSTVLLIALFMASLAHARESQFFSKATKDTTTQQQQQETFATDQHATLTKQQVDEPNFIPETTRTGYGLYGHESGQLPPSATTAEGRLPYRTTTAAATTVPQESLYSSYEQNNDNYEQYKNNGENSYFYNKDSYVTEEEKAAPLGSGYTATSTAALADRSTYYGGGNSLGNVKQEGMSDTRFMENGKYYYDIDNEEKYYPNYRYLKSFMDFL